MEGLTEGRIVHYIPLADGGDGAELASDRHCAAMVVRVFEPGGGPDGEANLLVFLDGSNDGFGDTPNSPTRWVTSRKFSETNEPGTWHWPERTTPVLNPFTITP